MKKQTGVVITVVAAVLTLCCSATCCATGIYTVAAGDRTLDIEPYAGAPVICLGALVWIVPLLLWLFLVRGNSSLPQGDVDV